MSPFLLRRSAALGLLAVLGACSQMPTLPPEAQPAPPESLASAQSLASSPEGRWPQAGWWQTYGDPQLDAWEVRGLRGAPSLAQARARLLRAQATVGQGEAGLLPRVGAQLQIQEARPSEVTGIPVATVRQGWNDTWQTGLDFSWDLDFWGRQKALVQGAQAQAQAAQAELAAAQLMLSAAIAERYATWVGLNQDRADLARQLTLRERTLALVQARVDAGYDTEVVLQQAKAAVHMLRSELAGVDQTLQATGYQLAALAGEGPDAALPMAAPQQPRLQAGALPIELPAELLGRRPDLTAARWRVVAARAGTQAAEVAFYPNVNLVGLIGLQSLGLGPWTEGRALYGSAGPALSLPLFDGGRRAADYTAARADSDLAVASYHAVLTQALQEVATAIGAIRALDRQSEEAQAALQAAERAATLARLRYEQGRASALEVLVAEDRHLAQQRITTALVSQRFTQDIALHRALGGGYQAVELPR